MFYTRARPIPILTLSRLIFLFGQAAATLRFLRRRATLNLHNRLARTTTSCPNAGSPDPEELFHHASTIVHG
ncbi:MAG: hypothetical protein SNJ75_17005, partial [Gemmataceae bacterium]